MHPTAVLHEIFSSPQGEGPYTGIDMTFVRFQGCSLRCRWCDTKESLPRQIPQFRYESPARSAAFIHTANPCHMSQLNSILEDFDDDWIALTGGEPLEQADFLAAWLPTLSSRRKFLLETDGVMTKGLQKIVAWVDVVSMDIKLPSSTGMRAYWEMHETFLRVAHASGKTTYVKMVVDADTNEADVARAAALIAGVHPDIPTILQTASATPTFGSVPSQAQLALHVSLCQSHLRQVSIGQQMHKVWGVL